MHGWWVAKLLWPPACLLSQDSSMLSSSTLQFHLPLQLSTPSYSSDLSGLGPCRISDQCFWCCCHWVAAAPVQGCISTIRAPIKQSSLLSWPASPLGVCGFPRSKAQHEMRQFYGSGSLHRVRPSRGILARPRWRCSGIRSFSYPLGCSADRCGAVFCPVRASIFPGWTCPGDAYPSTDRFLVRQSAAGALHLPYQWQAAPGDGRM